MSGHDPFRVALARNAGLRDAIPSGLERVAHHPVGGSAGSEVQSALDVTGRVCVSWVFANSPVCMASEQPGGLAESSRGS
jgi:hypothetical protein